MRRSLLGPLLLLGACSVAASGAAAQGQGERPSGPFLRLSNPTDTQCYGLGATCVITGSLQLPKSGEDASSLLLRLRAFRPGRQAFVIANEAAIPLEKAATQVTKRAAGERLYVFQARLRLPQEPGEYLLRVDCLDLKRAKYPDSLVATQSLFIEIVGRARPADNSAPGQGK
jgi:hypothetical protein